MGSGTWKAPSGYFKTHNEEVIRKLESATSLKAAVKAYGMQIATDAKALHDAGASDEQIAASMKALEDQFDSKAWPAIVKGKKEKA